MELKKVQLIICTIGIVCLIHSCSNKGSGYIGEKPVIRINEFEVSLDKFYEEFNRLIACRNEMANNEAALLLFDNFLSLGILTESTDLNNYEINNNKKFNKLKTELLVESIISRDLDKYEDISFSSKEIERIYSKNILVDYIRIPNESKGISSLIFNRLKSGSSIDVLLNQTEKREWDSLGLSFYVEAPIESLLLPKKVLNGIVKMNENEVKIIKTAKAFHVVHVFKKFNRINEYIDKEKLRLNLKKAYALEDGVLFFDDYLRKNLIDFNNKLISNVDFTFPTVCLDSVQNKDLIATIGHKIFSKNDIVNIVSKLPVKVQSLFRNKSTRIDAIATLVLLINNHFEKEMKYPEVPDIDRIYQDYLINLLKKNEPNDTVSFLEEWILDKTAQFETNSISSIIEKEINSSQTLDNEEKWSKQSACISFKLPSDYYTIMAWYHPEKLKGAELLKLNYKAIESSEFAQGKTYGKDNIVASMGNWSLTIESINDELNQLTPETRMDISQNDNLIKMINYLACEAKGKSDNIRINYPVLKDIDVIGYSLDSLNDTFNEDSVLASFEGIAVTVGELREIVNEFSTNKRRQFIDYNSQKTDIILSEIFNRYWLNKVKKGSIENEEIHKLKLKQSERFMVAKDYYKSQIAVSSIIVDNIMLNVQLQKAIGLVNKKRLIGYLSRQSDKLKVEVDKATLENNYNLNTGLSIFDKEIQVIEN